MKKIIFIAAMSGLFVAVGHAQTSAAKTSTDKTVIAKATTKPVHKTAVSSKVATTTTTASTTPKKATPAMRRKKHTKKHSKAHTKAAATTAPTTNQ